LKLGKFPFSPQDCPGRFFRLNPFITYEKKTPKKRIWTQRWVKITGGGGGLKIAAVGEL
jgi:hypothetical protein